MVTAANGIGRLEPKAKAALINFLRRSGSLERTCALSAELIIDKQAARADLALVTGKSLHCFEIKTARDTLIRLDKQIEIYSAHADMVTVVAATRHVNAALSRLPKHVGIFELVSFSGSDDVRVVRQAKTSASHDPVAMLSLLPATEIQKRLLPNSNQRRRVDMVREASVLPADIIKAAVIDFMCERYRPTTSALLQATRRRAIKPDDLIHLRRWRAEGNADAAQGSSVREPVISNLDQETYRHVGQSFGPVPTEIRELLGF